MLVAIVGASGFVGQALIRYLLDHSSHTILALSRNAFVLEHPAKEQRLVWKSCDLHNLRQLEENLVDADVAVYLVHSMLPSARLNQGSFADFDLSLADNFARTAKRNGIQRVIYLSGLVPETGDLSEHLRSRKEVEEVLRYYLDKVTCLRAGMIVGPTGSSFTVMVRLVQRLPFMILPAWTNNRSQVIALDDVVRCLGACIDEERTWGQTIDIGAEPPLSYAMMLDETAKLLGKRRLFITFPIFSVSLSKLWVSVITGAPRDLIYPLIESLKESMLVRPQHAWPLDGWQFQPFRDAARAALLAMRSHVTRRPHAFTHGIWAKKQNSVRSIQRLPLPSGRDAKWVAEQYLLALPRIFPLLIKVIRSGDLIHLQLRGLGWNLLILEYSRERSAGDRQLFYVRGGLLSSRSNVRGRLELRETLCRRFCLAAVHDFRPSLPWLIYRVTQAEVHSLFMRRLGRSLERMQIESVARLLPDPHP
jgi:uncharacterized protein YbjT (DUF2867 family)